MFYIQFMEYVTQGVVGEVCESKINERKSAGETLLYISTHDLVKLDCMSTPV